MSRRLWAVGLLVVAVALAGCFSASVEVDVADDGALDRMEITMELDSFLYAMLEDEAHNEGYESVEESILADFDEPGWSAVEYAEEVNGDAVLTITLLDGDPGQLDTISVAVDDDAITFVETDAFGELDDDEFDEFAEHLELEYVVNMPGEITETNGDVLDDGQSVRWTFADHSHVDRFEVTSERAEASSIPGFGVAAALVVGLVTALSARVWRQASP